MDNHKRKVGNSWVVEVQGEALAVTIAAIPAVVIVGVIAFFVGRSSAGTKGRIAKSKRPEGWKPGDDEKPRGGNSRGGNSRGGDRRPQGNKPTGDRKPAAKSDAPRTEKHGEGEHKRPPRQRNRTRNGGSTPAN